MDEPGEEDRQAGDRTRRVVERWSDDARRRGDGGGGFPTEWTALTMVQRAVNRRISGDPERNLVGFAKRVTGGNLDRALSVGCGTGTADRDALEQGLCRRIVGVDIAGEAVEVARRLAGGLPASYLVADIEAELPGGFDLLICVSALHHVCRLRQCLQGFHDSLSEGGLLLLSEFAGPSRFQWTDRQVELIGDIYGFLPPEYRFNRQAGETGRFGRPELCAMVLGDPSEAVRSTEMMELVERYFEPIEVRPAGGTLLLPLLGGIVANFDENDSSDRAFVALGIMLEDALIASGALPSDMVAGVYRRRDAPLLEPGFAESQDARSARIAEQEADIVRLQEAIARRDGRNRALDSELKEITASWMGVTTRIEECRSRLETLKRGPVFGLLKRAGTRGGASGPSPRPEAGLPPSLAPPAGSGIPLHQASMEPPTAGSAAVKAYVSAFPRGNASLWMEWLSRTVRRPERALLVGLDRSHAMLAEMLGICDTAEVAVSADAAPDGGYGLVIADRRSYSRECLEALAPGGSLATISTTEVDEGVELQAAIAGCLRGEVPDIHASRPPEPEPPEPPEGMRQVARKSFPLRTSLAGALGGAAPGDGTGAGLLEMAVYVEWVLADAGLIGPRLEVRVHVRAGEAGRWPKEATSDIVSAQDALLERLRETIRRDERHTGVLERAVADARRTLEASSSTLERLRREEEILEKPGPARYPRWIAHRLGGGRR